MAMADIYYRQGRTMKIVLDVELNLCETISLTVSPEYSNSKHTFLPTEKDIQIL